MKVKYLLNMKVCCKCSIEKKIDEFYLEKRNKTGVMGLCKDCYNIKQKEWRKENRDKIKNRYQRYYQENKEKITSYRENNKDNIKIKLLNWRKNNPERNKELLRNWRKNNPHKVKQYRKLGRERGKFDTLFNIKQRMRCRLHHFLNKCEIAKKTKTFDILGCSPYFLKQYLEKQFKDGMTWDNRNEWHIDHIIPLSSAKTEDEIYKLCHYTNLQPLWAEDNLKKGNKILNNS
jgi:hypothetical protein